MVAGYQVERQLVIVLWTIFKTIFTTSHPTFPAGLENLIPQSITDEDNEWICRIPDYGEIKSALFSLGSHKSPGPDSMLALFYKHYWSIVEFDVVNLQLVVFVFLDLNA